MNAISGFMMGLASLALAASALSACGGGGGGGGNDTGDISGTPPSIAGLAASQSVGQDTTSDSIAFSVSDAQSSAADIQVTADSSAPALISANGILITGSGESRALTLTPEEGVSGAAAITIRATDSDSMTTEQTFNVTVTTEERSFKEMAETAFSIEAEGTPEQTRGFTWVGDPGDDPAAFDHLLGR